MRGNRVSRTLRLLNNPSRVVQGVWKRYPVGSFDLRCRLDIFDRPHYAYGLQQGAALAAGLGLPAISAVEFGVAGGRGLLELESLAQMVSESTGVKVEVYGFDRGEGLPEVSDYRDLPYTWRKGFFRMDVESLQARLQNAKLVLGDIAETVPRFVDEYRPAPLAFVSIDVDYYSSTVDALKVFDLEARWLLPRVMCYFDDTVGEDHVLQNRYVGELLAIEEFNEAHPRQKVVPIHGLSAKRDIPAPWNDCMYAMHKFDHPEYDTYVGPAASEQELRI
jgi:hypothetical protein